MSTKTPAQQGQKNEQSKHLNTEGQKQRQGHARDTGQGDASSQADHRKEAANGGQDAQRK